MIDPKVFHQSVRKTVNAGIWRVVDSVEYMTAAHILGRRTDGIFEVCDVITEAIATLDDGSEEFGGPK